MQFGFFDIIVNIFSIYHLLVILAGILFGMLIGGLPGLTANMGIALLIPITFVMDSTAGLLMLTALYTAAIYGGSLPAILLHTPGTSASAATAIDGYELTKQGKGATAIRIATYSSAAGGLISAVALLIIAPPLSRLALLFGPSEYFFLAIFGLTAIGTISSDSLSKGLLAGAFGMILSLIGRDLVSGFPRFTFGLNELRTGISFVPAMIGLFALSQVLTLTESTMKMKKMEQTKLSDWKFFPTRDEVRIIGKTVVKSSIIGIGVGMLPGAGGDIGSWVSYSEAKRSSKHPELMGKGSIEGIAASESANNAVTGSSLIPLMVLGIPGSASAAILMGALMIKGLVPGRELFTTHAYITYTVMGGFLAANLFMGVIGMFLSRYIVKVTRIPNPIIIAAVTTLCVIGAYAVGNSLFDLWIMLFFGIFGYLIKKAGFHPAPIILGLILGPIAEKAFRQTLTLCKGNFLEFVLSRPITVVLILLILLTIITTINSKRKAARNSKEKS
jgi:putative tricarboxylic transport membrane protein